MKTEKTKAVPVKESVYGKALNKGVDVLIADAIKSAGQTKVKIQQAAVAILLHAMKHKDWRKANDLVGGLGNGVRRDALIEWFKTFGGLTVDDGQKQFTGWQGAEHIAQRLDKAKAKDWAECKADTPWGGFSLKESLQKVRKSAVAALDRLDKAVESGESQEVIDELAKHVNVTREQVIALDAMIGSLI